LSWRQKEPAAFVADAIATSADAARESADTVLRAPVGHERCTAQGRRWRLERHLVMLPAEDVDQYSNEIGK